MSHDEAIEKSRDYQHLVGKAFVNQNNERETIKAVVAWEESEGGWCPHVCFYNWPHEGQMSHMRVEDFLLSYKLEGEEQAH